MLHFRLNTEGGDGQGPDMAFGATTLDLAGGKKRFEETLIRKNV